MVPPEGILNALGSPAQRTEIFQIHEVTSMKLPGWEKVTSAEQYRQMIEAEYYKLQAQRSTAAGTGIGLEEIKLRLFLSLLEKPSTNGQQASSAEVRSLSEAADQNASLLNDNQTASDQAA
jgi:hypothetical protein